MYDTRIILWSVIIIYLQNPKPTICTQTNKKDIFIGGFYPLSGPFSDWGQGCLPAAELAVKHINDRSDVLEDYQLNLVNMDTQVRNPSIICITILSPKIFLEPNLIIYISSLAFPFLHVLMSISQQVNVLVFYIAGIDHMHCIC